MNSQRILLFPAGIAQREAFLAARKLGFEIITVDRNPEAACFPLADEYAVLDPGNADALVSYVRRIHAAKRLDGVLLVGCDIPISAARVAAELGSPGIGLDAAELTVDKIAMKKRLRSCGVPVPDFYSISGGDEVAEILSRENRRMIIKPNDNSGARGVQQLLPDSDPTAAYEHALANVKRTGVILEVFEEGVQISIEALVHQGQVDVTGFADRNYPFLDRFFPYVLENGATLPTALDANRQGEVIQTFIQGIHALGIDNSVAKGDMVLTEEGAKVIEIAGRISGGKFASRIVPESTGVELLPAALEMAVGRTPDRKWLTSTRACGVAVRYCFPPPGRVKAIKGLEEVKGYPGVLEVHVTYEPGDIIPPMRSHPDRGGWLVCKAETRLQVEEVAEKMINKLVFEVEP
ncbi:ATP-grasp domain-containing protein [Solemya velesiana gill symbiont]|uniref:ATP-grasp domain-containing protein n=1 Tax=Solemya velesiana gill symbiont TaxID=1918948 RepID=A0A1T2KUC0_9GAMM|nr:ATP-grasp domain-containing protein [Solemya velesiana gill symbiont]OOZ36445.1 hypothetical protein BOW51_07175 [Solemya velesiana gill symbiont]